MTQEQIKKYEMLKAELDKCEKAISLGVNGIFRDCPYCQTVDLPGAVCLEIEEIIKKWIDHYKKEIEKI